jgi:hypothetical protein
MKMHILFKIILLTKTLLACMLLVDDIFNIDKYSISHYVEVERRLEKRCSHCLVLLDLRMNSPKFGAPQLSIFHIIFVTISLGCWGD